VVATTPDLAKEVWEFHNHRITKLSYRELGDSFAFLCEEGWIPTDLRKLFERASHYCERQNKE